MKNNLCLGCNTYFEEGQRVPLESLVIEFKNYYLPIKESKQKWIILKTLVGFLNSKGGIIYIGIEDNEGKVIGQEIKRKQKDQFLLFIKSLADKIVPTVDLRNKEEISIVYVPVVSNKVFKGKYIIKVIVKQGDPSQTYHFSQQIQLQFKGSSQKYEIFHAFYRHNMGGIEQIKGQALIKQVARKAASPNEIANTFHQFCNPKPLKLEGPLLKIEFSGIRKEELRNKLQNIFHQNLQSFDVEYDLTYDIQNEVLLIELENEQQFLQINKYMQKHLKELNEGKQFNFIEKGEYLDFYLYKNIGQKRGLAPQSIQPQQQKGAQEKTKPVKKVEIPNRQDFESVQKCQKAAKMYKMLQQPEESMQIEDDKKQQQSRVELTQKMKERQQQLFSQSSVLTLTHLKHGKVQQLALQLKKMNQQDLNMTIEKYVSTIELVFASPKDLSAYHQTLMKQNQRISSYGEYNNLVIGINTKKIIIRGYNIRNRKQLKLYIEKKVKNESQEIQYKKLNNKYFLQITFKTRQLTCQWLDKLREDSNLQQYSRPGSKLRIYIFCECS